MDWQSSSNLHGSTSFTTFPSHHGNRDCPHLGLDPHHVCRGNITVLLWPLPDIEQTNEEKNDISSSTRGDDDDDDDDDDHNNNNNNSISVYQYIVLHKESD